MGKLSLDEIRSTFTSSKDFNKIFDAFEAAVNSRHDDIELYRQLFWNKALTPDELCLFGKKLAHEFPNIAYDVYMWLANVFELTFFQYDNYALAMQYYRKAAEVKPDEPDPYLDACDCYEPDLNIPPVDQLIAFCKIGTERVPQPKALYLRLARLYGIIGDEDQSLYYHSKASKSGGASGPQKND
jgi:tetratricopeptide (TPR) repeat protein